MTKWILPFAELLLLICPMAAHAQDPTGFTEQLNAVRANLGLPRVAYLDGGVAVSSANNAAQRQYGLGHFITNGLAQCAAIGCGDTGGTLAMWLNSPAHAAIILSPALSAVGYANDGYAASVACSMGQTAMPVAPTTYYQPRRGLFGRIK